MKNSILLLSALFCLNSFADVVPFNAAPGSEVLKIVKVSSRVSFSICTLNTNLDMKDCRDALTESKQIESYSLNNLEVARDVLMGSSRLMMLSALTTVGVPTAIIAGSRSLRSYQAALTISDAILNDLDITFYPQTDEAYTDNRENRSLVDQARINDPSNIVLYDWAKFRLALAVALSEARF